MSGTDYNFGVMLDGNATSAMRIIYRDNGFNPGTPLDVFLDFLLVACLLFSVYLFFVLSWFEIHLRRDFHLKYIENKRCLEKGREKKYISSSYVAVWLRILCILGAMSTVLRCINDFVWYKTTKNTHGACTVVKNLGVVWLVCIDTCVYMFLWVRQRVLYNKKSLRHLVKWYITVIGYICLLLIVGIFIAHNVLLIWRKYHFKSKEGGCEKIGHIVREITPYVWATGSTVLHILLVFLYVYPLAKHSITVNVQRRESVVSDQSISRSCRIRHDKSLMKVVKRCIVISLICVLTDGAVMCIAEYGIKSKDLTKLRHSLYNFNAGLNVFCITLSFKKWKQMLFPFIPEIKDNVSPTTSSKRSLRRENSYVSSYLHKSRKSSCLQKTGRVNDV